MNLNTPKPFTPQANRIGKDWQLWKKEFMIFLKLSGGYEKYSEENRANLLLNLMGSEGIKAMENMTFDHPNERSDMDILIMKFDEKFDPPLNEAEGRYKFFSRRKRENETIENFVADLKEKADACNFGKESNKFIIDMIIRNTDNYLREIIFALNDYVTIPDLIQYYNQYSASTDKIKEITKNLSNEDTKSSEKRPQPRNCWRCNTRHMQRNCPAYGTMCNVCNEKNHFNGLCKKKTTNSKKTEIPQNRICSKCGTNHPYQQCPAHDYTCYKCNLKGHYGNRCRNIPHDSMKKDEQIKKATDTIKQNEQKDMQYCLWCDSKHTQGQCQHNQHCTNCDKFPHNICFNCKKNPHEISCYYKSVITLPTKTLDLSSSVQKASSQTENSSNRNSISSSYCNICLKTGDHHTTCPRVLNNRQSTPLQSRPLQSTPLQCSPLQSTPLQRPPLQSTSLQSTTADPLLKDYVKINQNTPRSTQYQGSISYPNKTKPANDYRNNSQFQNNHKKNNPKDNCCIS